jgi:glycosyltransferase involved in cell wall biosynthesis
MTAGVSEGGRPLRVAILGTRGIPANYGGFETFAQELSVRLVKRGHAVTVYGRSHYVPRGLWEHEGVRLVRLPAVRHKYLDTVSHTFLSVLHALFRRFDVLLVCNAANAFCCWVPRLTGKKVVLNVDGLERNRKKWNVLGRLHYRVSETLSCWFPSAVVTDAVEIQRYYRDRYRTETTMIPYGADPFDTSPGETLARLGVGPGDYYLYVSRLEPENNAHLVVRLFEGLKTDRKLLVVGDAPYAREYIAALKAVKDPRIRFPGAIYGAGYRELVSNAHAYLHATEVGGTHPALVENLAAGNVVFCLDTPENREVVGDAGVLFDAADAAGALARLQAFEDDPAGAASLRARARARAAAHYAWDTVVEAYLGLFERLVRRKSEKNA